MCSALTLYCVLLALLAAGGSCCCSQFLVQCASHTVPGGWAAVSSADMASCAAGLTGR